MQVLLKTDLIFVEVEIASGPIVSHTTYIIIHTGAPLVILVISFLSLSSALPPEWVSVILNLLKEWNNHPHCSYFGESSFIAASADQPLSLFIPPVMIWSPLEQLQLVIPNGLTCPQCGASNIKIYANGWRDGSVKRLEPRKLHGLSSTVILVTRMYKCEYNHEIVGYDAQILTQIPKDFIPFRLWHRTSFTKELIGSQITSGVPIKSIYQQLTQNRHLAYFHRQKLVKQLLPGNINVPSFEEWISHVPSIAPSRHSISSCFLLQFWEKEHLYLKHMQSMSLAMNEEWLSCDHTFSSAGTLAIRTVCCLCFQKMQFQFWY